MRVVLPHTLGREEVRRRLHTRSGELNGLLPGGVAGVETDWPGEDRMHMALNAMGQTIDANVDIEDAAMIVTIDLPAALSFVRPIIEAAVRDKGTKMLK